jgi:hypothetical protein
VTADQSRGHEPPQAHLPRERRHAAGLSHRRGTRRPLGKGGAEPEDRHGWSARLTSSRLGGAEHPCNRHAGEPRWLPPNAETSFSGCAFHVFLSDGLGLSRWRRRRNWCYE